MGKGLWRRNSDNGLGNICEMPSYLANNSAWEMQFNIVHDLHVTPA